MLARCPGHLEENMTTCIQEFLRSLDGDEVTANVLARLFIETCPSLQQRLDAAIQAQDQTVVRGVLHEIRGGCAIFSAHACIAWVRQMEHSLGTQPDGEFLRACISLKHSLADLNEELRNFLDTPGSCRAAG